MAASPPPFPPPSGPIPEHGVELLRDMLRIRRFEEACAELYSATKIRGFLHLYIGEEAVATGTMRALGPDDAIVATYREHGHALLRGVGANALMAEMFGRSDGCSGGRGGSMHIFDANTRFYGGNAIVAGGLPIAVGLALADRMLGRDRVTACFFGEGAMAEGEFHESLNLAALWNLPVLFLCENNHYAMGSALELTESQTNLALKAACYEVAAWTVDGMDVVAVERETERAVLAIRGDGGPVFLEAQTYRFRAHSMYDPDLYRDHAEVAEWKERHDPIELFAARLREQGMLDDATLEGLERDIAAELETAIAFAEASEPEPVESLTRHLYAPGPA
ncbi:MAG TPA: pyruvate dehydrogenase (acetyl-transferring) E1 component subunit alpha [Solirubrobacteraceae bacterium]|nr:pyruvate dehydrogenase (acetyl-transferring) E1 component subunit alpha [Solirubrobacteraceae bacterium]